MRGRLCFRHETKTWPSITAEPFFNKTEVNEMSLVVSTNISSLAAQRSLNEVDRDMKVAMERLATGQRINGAADDAAGLAVSQRMEAQIGGLNQAIRNTQDGLAMVDTIEASMNEGNDILQRMRTLAAQAATLQRFSVPSKTAYQLVWHPKAKHA